MAHRSEGKGIASDRPIDRDVCLGLAQLETSLFFVVFSGRRIACKLSDARLLRLVVIVMGLVNATRRVRELLLAKV
jgi:hypothetical protein